MSQTALWKAGNIGLRQVDSWTRCRRDLWVDSADLPKSVKEAIKVNPLPTPTVVDNSVIPGIFVGEPLIELLSQEYREDKYLEKVCQCDILLRGDSPQEVRKEGSSVV